MNKEVYNVIKNQLSMNKISHAYLIETDNLIEFETELKEVLKLFLCEKSPNICNSCQHCNYIDRLEHPNVIIIKPDGNYIKIDQIERLQEKLKYKTSYSRYNIYIIYGAESLNQTSANALLKTLEEPETNIIALLLTQNKNLILPTIVSRCQCLKANYKSVEYSDNIISLANEIESIENSEEDMLKYTEIIKKLDDKNDLKYAFSYLLSNAIDKKNIKKVNILKDIVDQMRYNVNIELLLLNYLIKVGDIGE